MYENQSFIITIPTYRRSQFMLDEKGTIIYLNKFLLGRTVLCCRIEEIKEYTKVKEYYCTNHEYFKNISNIVETRDRILEYSYNTILDINNKSVPLKYLIMLDDDIKFAYRPGYSNIYKDMTKTIFEEMIKEMLLQCDGEHPIVGILPRQFSNNFKTHHIENHRIIQVYCFYLPVIKKTGIHFCDAGFPYMTDYYFILKMMQLGYKNLVLCKYTKDDTRNTDGGCFVDRTVDKLNKSAMGLYKTFPELITLNWKRDKILGKYLNPRIAWKKAYKER
ncbi:MAG: hypothetical protein P8Y70_00280 [Candidatus Lokiarchaeota archaeon]